jgi:hypothetical protein
MQSVPQHVLSFTWRGSPVHIFLNAYTSLPSGLEWTRAQPYGDFGSVWGDVTTRVLLGNPKLPELRSGRAGEGTRPYAARPGADQRIRPLHLWRKGELRSGVWLASDSRLLHLVMKLNNAVGKSLQ